MKLTHEQAVAFFATLYRGEHHIPGAKYKGENVRPCGHGWSVSHFGDLSSWDADALTRLVLLAHERCVRVEVSQGGPNRLRIAIWGRERAGGIAERHPTIEQAVEHFRLHDDGWSAEWDTLARKGGV